MLSFMHSEYFAGIAKYDYLAVAHAIDDKSALGIGFMAVICRRRFLGDPFRSI